MKKEEKNLLNFSIKVTRKSLSLLKKNQHSKFTLSRAYKKEYKSAIDVILNTFIKNELNKTKIKIFSEEDKAFDFQKLDEYVFVIDPLDGTYNYVRGIYNCAVSISLMKKNKIIFGVIGTFPDNNIYWGGKSYGSFKNNKKIKTSKNKNSKDSVIATGFPARFNFNKINMNSYLNKISVFAKVRMLGSAALSLSLLAEGRIDCYFEENIMIWDVAAGLAITEGAGGKINYKNTNIDHCYIVNASNGILKFY